MDSSVCHSILLHCLTTSQCLSVCVFGFVCIIWQVLVFSKMHPVVLYIIHKFFNTSIDKKKIIYVYNYWCIYVTFSRNNSSILYLYLFTYSTYCAGMIYKIIFIYDCNYDIVIYMGFLYEYELSSILGWFNV